MQILAESFWSQLVDEGEIIPVVAIALGSLIAVVAIIAGSTKAIVVSRARETTKRELAAYVAEGSLDPEKAVALIEAGAKTPAADA
jgi:hypothetical protein